MTALQTIAVALAMFSALPMPQFDWNEKNMRYALCAFPLVGAVCGALWCVCGVLPLPAAARAAGFCLVPVWVTGGIHLDGYADTCDALSSYGDTANTFATAADRVRVRQVLAALCAMLAVGLTALGGWALVLAAGCVFARYYVVSKKQFGGVTGDLAGWFLQKCEIWMLAALAACQWLGVL